MIEDYHKQSQKYSNLLIEVELGKAIVKDNKPKKDKLGNTPFRSNIPKDHKQSKGEALIECILRQKSIKFLKEVEFSTCRNPLTKRCFRFDFFLEDIPACIEFDGIQHYESIEEFDGIKGEENLKKRKIYDGVKSKFCKKNKIKLLRIRYDQVTNTEKMIDHLISNKGIFK